MKCALVGSRFFAASVFEALRKEEGIEFTSIVAPAEDDRLALAARAAGVAVHVLDNPRIVPEHAIAEGTDLIIAQTAASATTNPTQVGPVHYTENYEIHLDSLVPLT